MRYVLMVSNDVTAPISSQERSWRDAAFVRFEDQMRRRGTMVIGGRIEASGTATVRCWDGGDVITSAGSNPLSGEQLSGVFVVDCANLDEAIDVATMIPTAWFGTVVVSPFETHELKQEDRVVDEDDLTALAAG
jgi:hypothetical protein